MLFVTFFLNLLVCDNDDRKISIPLRRRVSNVLYFNLKIVLALTIVNVVRSVPAYRNQYLNISISLLKNSVSYLTVRGR